MKSLLQLEELIGDDRASDALLEVGGLIVEHVADSDEDAAFAMFVGRRGRTDPVADFHGGTPQFVSRCVERWRQKQGLRRGDSIVVAQSLIAYGLPAVRYVGVRVEPLRSPVRSWAASVNADRSIGLWMPTITPVPVVPPGGLIEAINAQTRASVRLH